MKIWKRFTVVFFIILLSVFLVSCKKTGDNLETGGENTAAEQIISESAEKLEMETASEEQTTQTIETVSAPGKDQKLKEDNWEEIPFPLEPLSENLSQETDLASLWAGLHIPQTDPDNYPKVDGSTATLPLSLALYQASTGASKEEAENKIIHYKTTNAYYGLLRGDTDLVIAYEPSEEFYADMNMSETKLTIHPVGKDALVFLANQGNKVNSLTEQQLVDIYSGKISSWAEVGGENKEIVAFQRPKNSGSQNLMEKLVMKDHAFADAPVSWIMSEMGDLVNGVASYNNEENALGYSVYYYAQNMYTQPGLRFMSVNQVEPGSKTIKSGEYPFVNEFYVAVRSDCPVDSMEYRLFQWLTGEEGQTFVESLGYVGVKETGAEAQEDIRIDVPSVTEGAVLGLKDNERVAISGQFALDVPGTILMGNSGKQAVFIKDYEMVESVSLIDITQPQRMFMRMGDAEGEEYAGLRDIGENRWVIPPRSGNMEDLGDGLYRRIFYQEDDSVFQYINIKGQIILESDQDHDLYRVGSHIWSVSKSGNAAAVYDRNGNLTNTVDFSPYGETTVRGGWDDEYFELELKKGNLLFDQDGKLFLSWSMIPEEVLQELKKQSAGDEEGRFFVDRGFGGKVVGLRYGETDYAYDTINKKLLSNAGDTVSFWPVGEGFSVTNETGTRIYDVSGNIMKTNDGRLYQKLLGDSCYGLAEPGIITIGDAKKKIEYTFSGNYSPQTWMDGYGGRLFIFRNEDAEDSRKILETDVYHDGKRIASGPDAAVVSTENYIVVAINLQDHIRFNFDGELLATSGMEEVILEEPGVKVVCRGNYIIIMNDSGQTAAALLSGYMSDD